MYNCIEIIRDKCVTSNKIYVILENFSIIYIYLIKFIIFRVHVRTSDGRQGWLPMSILMQTALSEESSSMSRPEDSHYRREYVFC